MCAVLFLSKGHLIVCLRFERSILVIFDGRLFNYLIDVLVYMNVFVRGYLVEGYRT